MASVKQQHTVTAEDGVIQIQLRQSVTKGDRGKNEFTKNAHGVGLTRLYRISESSVESKLQRDSGLGRKKEEAENNKGDVTVTSL